MSWLSSFLNPGKGYDEGQKELEKYYNQAQGYLQPYNNNGQQQYGNLQEIINNFMHPEKLQDEWVKNYKESEAAKNTANMAQQQGLDAASSMGLIGSSPALQAIQGGTANVVAQDRQNYLNDLMQKYLSGAGLSQNIYGVGANTAGSQSTNAMNMGTNSANNTINRENAGGNLLGGLIGMGGRILGHWNPFGGGGK
jgi:hypothetical protein